MVRLLLYTALIVFSGLNTPTQARKVPDSLTVESPKKLPGKKNISNSRKKKSPRNASLSAEAPPLATKSPSSPIVLPPAVPVKQEPDPDEGKPAVKKTLTLDARRLDDTTLEKKIEKMKAHPSEVRFRLENMVTNPRFAVPILTRFREEGLINRIKEITFVITSKDNESLVKKDFIDKIVEPFLTDMECLELNCLGVTDDLVKEISQLMPKLTELSLFGPSITDTSVTHLANALPDLKKIHLLSTDLTTAGVQKLIEKFSALTAVGLSGTKLTSQDFLNLGKAMQNKNLQAFSIAGQTVGAKQTVEKEQALQNFNFLKDLWPCLPKLKTLDLSGTNITDDILSSLITNVKGLKNLNISETYLTKDGIREIAENFDLVIFKMNNLTGLGDEDLKFIATHQPNLKKFHFEGVNFSDYSIMEVLYKLTNLTDITLIPPADSKWVMTPAVAAILTLKPIKLQYLHIQPDRLTEEIWLYLVNHPAYNIIEENKPTSLLYIEYQP